MKRSLNDFGAFDKKPGAKKWVFWLKTDKTRRWVGNAPDWFMGRQLASRALEVEPSQLVGVPDDAATEEPGR